jgi:tellurite resistance protein TerB
MAGDGDNCMPHPKSNRLNNAATSRQAQEAAAVLQEDLANAMVAACALIAFADGSLHASERKRVLQLFRSIPAFDGFSSERVSEEFTWYELAFEDNPEMAHANALQVVEALKPHVSEARMLLSACQHILEADGIYHPREYQALYEIGKALGAA